MKLSKVKTWFIALLLGLLLIVGCTPLKKASAEEAPANGKERVSLEVVALDVYGATQEFVSAFSGMTLHYRYEVDCPDMAVVKVQAANGLEEADLWDGVKTLAADMKIVYTADGKEFALVDQDFLRVKAVYEPMTFVEVCQHLNAGGIVVSEQQHYIQFE